MNKNRMFAQISCLEILEELSDYVEGFSLPARAKQIDEHLAQCDNCRAFGDHFTSTLARFRETMKRPTPMRAEEKRYE